MLISKKGIVLRTELSEIRETGRNTQGVILMKFDNDDEIAGIAIMQAEDDSDIAGQNGFSREWRIRFQRQLREPASES